MSRLYNFLNYINEGGNAIKSSSRINVDNVQATCNDIYNRLLPVLNISKKDINLLGSTGKKSAGSHGDIDLALNIESLVKNNNLSDIENVISFIEHSVNGLTHEIAILKGFGIVSIAWPIINIDGKQKNEFVQLDLMLAKDMNWMIFKNFSPSDVESEFKGAHRAVILADSIRVSTYITRKQKDGIDVEWERLYITDDGVYKKIETLLGTKNDKILKSPKLIDKIFVTRDSNKVAEIIFGKGFTVKDLNSFESILKVLNNPNCKLYKDREKVFRLVPKSLQRLGYPTPKSLAKYA